MKILDRDERSEGVATFLEKRPAKFELKPSEMPEFYPWWTPREFK